MTTPDTRLRRRGDRWWSLVAPGYDRAVALVGWYRWQDALLSDVSSGRVLDVGCGPAHLGEALLARDVTYVGVDRNAAMIHSAERRLRSSAGRGMIVRGDVTALPFRGRSFDIVVSTGVLGLLDVASRRGALQEMVRVACAEIRLLEPVHRFAEPSRILRSRLIGLVRDRPIELDELIDVGLEPEVCGRARLAGVYSMVRATKI